MPAPKKAGKAYLRTIGAAAGGIAGKQLFSVVKDLFADPNTVGAVQAACLAVITLGTLLYTLLYHPSIKSQGMKKYHTFPFPAPHL